MILPSKYISFDNSYFCLSALILKILGESELDIEKLWKKISRNYQQIGYERFIKTLVFMKTCNFISLTIEGKIINDNIRNSI